MPKRCATGATASMLGATRPKRFMTNVCRMREFYLTACEMLFRNGPLMIQLAHRRDAVPLTRDYVYERKTRQHWNEPLATPSSSFGEAVEANPYRPMRVPQNSVSNSMPTA